MPVLPRPKPWGLSGRICLLASRRSLNESAVLRNCAGPARPYALSAPFPEWREFPNSPLLDPCEPAAASAPRRHQTPSDRTASPTPRGRRSRWRPSSARRKPRDDHEPPAEVGRDDGAVAVQPTIAVNRLREPVGGVHRRELPAQQVDCLSRRAAPAHDRRPGSATILLAAGCSICSSARRAMSSLWLAMCRE